ncbi:amidohydrolase family protein [Roseibacterium sp. SDUM158016]|uniref:amidohydrolase family protein n=1 Tax=Roseicyclus sediminis TaxID=2980997 RepID=UPI0021D079E0|nr:amidohydrolase family protein [Roseibacterium sp. SDUM158016]MCU4653728.1 amidohydrolase family protein [Roseibacterium sp. SDUM158016]
MTLSEGVSHAGATAPVADPDYLPFHPAPSRPVFRPPAGAVDAHCHVFGPAAVFPFSPRRKYTPVDAPAETLFALRDHLGLSRNVIVQATCHGPDNSAMLDAIARSEGRARGVAVVDPDIAEEDLRRLHDGGVRGVRFNFLKRLVGDAPKDDYIRIAARVTELGWHIVVYFESAELADLGGFVRSLPGTIVIDHMGRPDLAEGLAGEGFARVLALMESDARFWIKVSCPERLTVAGPPYDDVVPFARTLVEGYPDRVLWGTDWPHPNMRSHMPDDGTLVDMIPRIAPTGALRKKLLIDNPMRLYWPEEAGA